MTFKLAAAGISTAMGAGSASAARQAYKEALKGVETTLAASDKNINDLMNPYRWSGRKGLNMLDAAISPTASPDYAMPENPGQGPVSDWRNYATLDQPPARPGLAGMVRK